VTVATIRSSTDRLMTQLGGQWFTVYLASVPDKPPSGYVTVYPGVGNAHADNMATDGRVRWTCRLVCSGFGPQQTLDVVDSVRARLTGWAPYPDTPSAGRLFEVDEDAPLLPDDTVPGDTRFSLTLTYRLYTNRS
jgi:hypothetical protein